MRYAIINKGLSPEQVKQEVEKHGGTNIKTTRILGEVFADLSSGDATALAKVTGLAVRIVKNVKAGQITIPTPVPAEEVYTSLSASLSSHLWYLRNRFSPPLSGNTNTVCVLDTGIRKSHAMFNRNVTYTNPVTGETSIFPKIIRERNFSDSPSLDDIFDHGTGVAHMIGGGYPMPDVEQGLAPDCYLMNYKVLNDIGEGTTEQVVMAIEDILELRESKMPAGGKHGEPWCWEPETPNLINLSLGTFENIDDPDDPMRVAIRYAVAELKMGVVASAGNDGPNFGTITSPAVEPYCLAVGAISLEPFEICRFSSRGPTKGGVIKPEYVFFGSNFMLASSQGDNAYIPRAGTSFACGAVSGAMCVVDEISDRYIGRCIDPIEDAALFAEIGLKPEGALKEKDNTYGFGMPDGRLMLEALAPWAAEAPPFDIGTLISSISPIIILGMIAPIMKGVVTNK